MKMMLKYISKISLNFKFDYIKIDDKGTFNIKDDITLQHNLTVIFSNSSYKILKENNVPYHKIEVESKTVTIQF